MNNKILQSRKPTIISRNTPTQNGPTVIKPVFKKQETLSNNNPNNNIYKTHENDKIRDAIIEPIKITNKNNKLTSEFDARKDKYTKELPELWKERTDDPYKIIIKDRQVRHAKSTKDLVVHTVTEKDKKDTDKKYQEYRQNIEKHNSELKMIYSLSNEGKNKEAFTYNVVYGNRTVYDPKNHTDMKNDQIKYYIEEQKKMDNDKKRIDNIIENIVNEKIFETK